MRAPRPAAAAALLVLAWPAVAGARVGGGHSYSSGSRSSYRPSTYRPSYSTSSSSSSSTSTPSSSPPATTWTYTATDPGPVPGFEADVLTCPSDDCKDPTRRSASDRDSRDGWGRRAAALAAVGLLGLGVVALGRRRRTPVSRPQDVTDLLTPHDPAFSPVLFLDFAVLLYVRVLESGGRAEVAPYLRAGVLRALTGSLEIAARPSWPPPAASPPGKVGSCHQQIRDLARGRSAADSAHEGRAHIPSDPVTGDGSGARDVVVGAVRIEAAEAPANGEVTLDVAFEASYTVDAGRRWRSELWTFSRRKGVPSRDPDAILRLGCPSCGAAGELSPEGRCGACGNVVDTGEHGWVVTAVRVRESRPLEALAPRLEPGGDEPGTRLPTVVQPDLQARLRALQARAPDFAWDSFVRFATETFVELQAAWSSLAWERARALETDALYQTHRFWIERYRRQGLRNDLRDPVVEAVELAAVGQDAFYDSVTVRIRARLLDTTVDASGRVVGGDPKVPRRFTEYWTFVRRAGVTLQGPATRGACPSCAAPLRVSAAGVCGHCETKVTTGRFGWVLAVIEQDESYR